MTYSFEAASKFVAVLYLHSPGQPFDQTERRDVVAADSMPNFPPECYRFQLFQNIEVGVGPFVLGTVHSQKPVTGFQYLGGEEFTLEQLKGQQAEKGGLDELIQIMEENRLKTAVKTKFGRLIPLSENDMVLKI